MIRMMDFNPSKRYSSKEIQDSNWLESTINEFNTLNKVDKSLVVDSLELWIKMTQMDDIEKCIQRAISKSVTVVNVDYINKIFFTFDKNNTGRFDKTQFVSILKTFNLPEHT